MVNLSGQIGRSNLVWSVKFGLVGQIWFGRSNAKVGWKMSDDWPLS